MLEILILFVVICLVIGIIKAIFDALKDVILGILGIGIIVAAIVFLGPVILSALPVLLSFLPWIFAILAGLFILGCIISLFEKAKYRSQLEWLRKRGIDKISASSEEWSRPKELGFVETTSSGYVISTSFYKKVVEKIGRKSALTQNEVSICCAQSAPQFQIIYFVPLFDFLCAKNSLVPFTASKGETLYLSEPFVKKCEKLFLNEGAATQNEFALICKNSFATQEFQQKSQELAASILRHMLSSGEVQEIDLPDLGEKLYVATKQQSNSKMTRREINLND